MNNISKLNLNRKEKINKHNFDITTNDIKNQILSIIDLESLKSISPRTLYNEPYLSKFTAQQREYLMDNGLISCKPTTQPEKKETYNSENDISMIGINHKLDNESMHSYVSQGKSRSSQDEILVSDGFSQCHAVILYNKETCSAMMLHVVDRDFDQEHQADIKEFLKDSPESEAIFVYGSESRCYYESDYKFLNKLGCNCRNIYIGTGPYHWGLNYNPQNNKINIYRKTPPMIDVLIYQGFSEQIYDKTRRENYDIENRMRKLEYRFLSFNKMLISDTEGIFNEERINLLIQKMEKLFKRKIDKAKFLEYGIENNICFYNNEEIIIPKLFVYNEKGQIYKDQHSDYNIDYKLKFYNINSTQLYYEKLLCYLIKNNYKFEKGNKENSILINNTTGQKLLITYSWEHLEFFLIGKWEDEEKKRLSSITQELINKDSQSQRSFDNYGSGRENKEYELYYMNPIERRKK